MKIKSDSVPPVFAQCVCVSVGVCWLSVFVFRSCVCVLMLRSHMMHRAEQNGTSEIKQYTTKLVSSLHLKNCA